VLRSLKPLRIIKLLKAFKIVSVLKEELAIVLGLNTVKMMALFGYLISSVHVCACGYWRAKLESNTQDEINAFLHARGADPQARGCLAVVSRAMLCSRSSMLLTV
jgi:hypothetical protein